MTIADDMTVSEWGQAMKQMGQERRAANRENSAELLRQRGVPFEEKNDGAHLIVRYGGKVVDFWPGTGKYSVRGSGVYKRGVFRLLQDIGVPKATGGAP